MHGTSPLILRALESRIYSFLKKTYFYPRIANLFSISKIRKNKTPVLIKNCTSLITFDKAY